MERARQETQTRTTLYFHPSWLGKSVPIYLACPESPHLVFFFSIQYCCISGHSGLLRSVFDFPCWLYFNGEKDFWLPFWMKILPIFLACNFRTKLKDFAFFSFRFWVILKRVFVDLLFILNL